MKNIILYKDKALVYCLSITAFIVIINTFVVFIPLMPSTGLDPSWVLGMNQAIAQKLNLGSDLIFTFGPYASLSTQAYHPQTDTLMLASSIYFGLLYFLNFFIWIKHTDWKMPALLILTCILGIVTRSDALFLSYCLIFFINCIYFNKKYSYSSQSKYLTIIYFLLCTPLGLLPLDKFSFSMICVLTSILSCILFYKNMPRMAFISIISPVIAMTFFWIVSGQNIFNIFYFIKNSLSIASGYTDAMSSYGNKNFLNMKWQMLLYIFSSIFTIFSFYKSNLQIKIKFFIIILFLAYLFVFFKHGFVRHDAHAYSAAVAIIISSIIIFSIVKHKWIYILCISSIFTWCIIDSNYRKYSTERIWNSRVYFSTAFNRFINRIKNNTQLPEQYNQALQKIYKKIELPNLNGTSDIYGHLQANIISSKNTWHPRPIFQSYSVYTPSLAEINRQHLLKANAPDNIFFTVETIDGRLPSLDDGASWPELLTRYEPQSFHKNYLILTKSIDSKTDTLLTPISTVESALNQRIPIPKSDFPIFCSLDITRTFYGTLANTFYKTGMLFIKLYLDNGSTQRFRIIPAMAYSGFLLSPFVKTTNDFALLYDKQLQTNLNKVVAFEITSDPGYETMWNKSFFVSFNSINTIKDTNFAKLYTFNKLAVIHEKQKITETQCAGSIDSFTIQKYGLANIKGWVANSIKDGTIPEKILLAVTNKTGESSFYEASRNKRPDVGKHFKNTNLENTGFNLILNAEDIPPNALIHIAQQNQETISICTNLSRTRKEDL